MTNYIKPISTGATTTISGESKDCTVRALANASGMSYVEAHRIMKENGRLHSCGAFPRQWTAAYLQHGFEVNGVHGSTSTACHVEKFYDKNGIPYKKQSGTSLKKFLTQNSEGTFILINRGHAFCVIDGELIDKGVLKENTYIAVSFRKI